MKSISLKRDQRIVNGKVVWVVSNPRRHWLSSLNKPSRYYRKDRQEREKDYWAERRKSERSYVKSLWSEFKKEKTMAQSDYADYRQQVYSQIPKLKVSKIPGQRGYAPIGGVAGRNIRREQSRRKRIRTEALKPVRKEEQALAKYERDIRNQARSVGAQLR